MDRSQTETIARLPLLASAPETLRQRIADIMGVVGEQAAVAQGEALLHEGHLGENLGYVLVEGAVTVEKAGTPPVRLNAPALFGEIQQFNPRAQRTATVRAVTPVVVIRFSWDSLYTRAKETLSEDEQHLLMDALERSACERLACEHLVDLAIHRGLAGPLKVRLSLALHWVAQTVTLTDGATLFEQNGLCGDAGYLLLHGAVELKSGGRLVRTLSAPIVIGIFPEFNPDLRWTATAIAKGDCEFRKFSWLNYQAALRRRLSQQEQRQFEAALEAAAAECLLWQ
jgi:hypothetical protein